ncbi:MAG: hypothetical protein A2297_08635 [Elusimicrobia bacterium RIFOXYB2_FULL_48_7]|nr:MAG: hypothetical protein A2297_08635 [Elusimicrobia bacterium RIFOXYB2_FULL_48_7]
MIKKTLVSCILVVLCTSIGLASDVSTVLNVRASLGNYASGGAASDFSGNLGIDFVPAIKFNDKLSLLPAVYLDYRGIKDVAEIVIGGDKVFMQSASYNVSVRPVYKIGSNTKLKLKAGVLKQYIVEAKNEDWGKGAFDYDKTTVGIDLAMKNATLGVSMYNITFPNYASLISQSTMQQQIGVTAAEVGTNLLDFAANDISAYGKMYPGSAFIIDWSLLYTMKNFSDQFVQKEDGKYKTDRRADTVTAVSLAPSFAIVPAGPVTIYAGLGISYFITGSNQNYYDVNTKDYIEKYYDYTETLLTPMFSFSFNTIPLKLGLSYGMSSRNYSQQPAKIDDNASGYVYGADKLKIDSKTLTLSIGYPLSDKLTLSAMMKSYDSSSNFTYTKSTEIYNFTSTNMYLGVSYEY